MEKQSQSSVSAVGIIAEYNPFHNGHAYQLKKAKELSGADYCIAAISGDFVQRGGPAVFDKYTRAAMALDAGADLVVELPPVFASSSAEDFAACGVALLDAIGGAICVSEANPGIWKSFPLPQIFWRKNQRNTSRRSASI